MLRDPRRSLPGPPRSLQLWLLQLLALGVPLLPTRSSTPTGQACRSEGETLPGLREVFPEHLALPAFPPTPEV